MCTSMFASSLKLKKPVVEYVKKNYVMRVVLNSLRILAGTLNKKPGQLVTLIDTHLMFLLNC